MDIWYETEAILENHYFL